MSRPVATRHSPRETVCSGTDFYTVLMVATSSDGDQSGRAAARERALTRLAAGDLELSKDEQIALSALDRENCDRFIAIFARLASDDRLSLLQLLTSLEDGAPLADFSAISLAAIADEEPTVRATAVAALGDYEATDTIEPLLVLARDDPHEGVRGEAVVALGSAALRAEFGQLNDRLRSRLVEGLHAIALDVAEESLVRASALASVAVIDEPWVRDLIFDFFGEGDDVLRLGAIQAMGRTADLYWLPTLENSMTVMDDDERIAAAVATGEIGDEDAVPALAELLDDESLEVVLATIEALGGIGGPDGAEQLERVSTHPDHEVRLAVQAAVETAAFADDPMGFSR